ncbi:hypothetical protein ABZ897_19320 [Nonomuraea sp. NPDC046802]|uniref:hypothetical protein n=1 Tax=Nonomuraea sp. NPDC046802 TaxID=3154919 RepID=UPI0033D802B0
MTRLRTVGSQAVARAGKPNERKLAQAQEDMARLRKRFFHRLRHLTTYELGSALWKLGRAREAAAAAYSWTIRPGPNCGRCSRPAPVMVLPEVDRGACGRSG